MSTELASQGTKYIINNANILSSTKNSIINNTILNPKIILESKYLIMRQIPTKAIPRIKGKTPRVKRKTKIISNIKVVKKCFIILPPPRGLI